MSFQMQVVLSPTYQINRYIAYQCITRKTGIKNKAIYHVIFEVAVALRSLK